MDILVVPRTDPSRVEWGVCICSNPHCQYSDLYNVVERTHAKDIIFSHCILDIESDNLICKGCSNRNMIHLKPHKRSNIIDYFGKQVTQCCMCDTIVPFTAPHAYCKPCERVIANQHKKNDQVCFICNVDVSSSKKMKQITVNHIVYTVCKKHNHKKYFK